MYSEQKKRKALRQSVWDQHSYFFTKNVVLRVDVLKKEKKKKNFLQCHPS